MPKQDYLSLLRQYMNPDAFTTLYHLVEERKRPPFEYDELTARLEPALDDIDPESMDTDHLDVVLTACDILNQHTDQLDIHSVQTTAYPNSGISEHTFNFTAEDQEYTTFMQLLQPMINAADIQVDTFKQPGHIRLRVKLSYYGEHDYQQKKEQLYFLRDLAKRKVKNAPYHGLRF